MTAWKIKLLWLLFFSVLIFSFYKLDVFLLIKGQVPLQDLDIYYQMGRDVIAGAHPYRLSYMPTGGPPLVIVPYLPLSILPLSWARSLMTVISLMAGLISCYLLAKNINSPNKYLVTLGLFDLLLLTFPARFSLLMGQPNLVLMLGVTLLLTAGKPKVRGLALALATVLKTHFLISWLALLGKHKKVLLTAVITIGAIGLLALPVIKPQYYSYYVRERGRFYVTPSISDQPTTDYYNQSLRSTMNRLGVGPYYLWVWLPLLAGIGFYLVKTGNIKMGILASFLLSPIVWQHYFVTLFPVLILMWWPNRYHWQISAWLAVISALIFIQLPLLHTAQLNLATGLVASHYFWGVVTLAVFLIWPSAKARRRTAS